MLSFILVLIGATIFIRIFINKFETKNKDVIALGLSFGVTVFLTFIQWIFGILANLIVKVIL